MSGELSMKNEELWLKLILYKLIYLIDFLIKITRNFKINQLKTSPIKEKYPLNSSLIRCAS